ncbi:hypothetical protein ANO11243_063250 [Dothideomycetidae sp. 11243]|nr:hypothetical protein ANO11243_063250 [fungal sp. No.11243]
MLGSQAKGGQGTAMQALNSMRVAILANSSCMKLRWERIFVAPCRRGYAWFAGRSRMLQSLYLDFVSLECTTFQVYNSMHLTHVAYEDAIAWAKKRPGNLSAIFRMLHRHLEHKPLALASTERGTKWHEVKIESLRDSGFGKTVESSVYIVWIMV